MTFKPVPRTLYLTGSSDPEWMICLPDGRCWDMYEGAVMLPAVGREGWRGWDWRPDRPACRVEIAHDLSDAEIASLAASDTRHGAVAAIISARHPCKAAPALEGDEAEVERWRKAAERAEADRQEWQALCLSHEGAIERLTRERDHYRALVRASLEAASAGEMADERLPEITRARVETIRDLLNERAHLRRVIVGLAAKIAGVRWLTSEDPDSR